MGTAPFFSEPADSPPPNADGTPAPRPPRINPWKMFVGSVIPNWLQCRGEVGQGAKLAYARLAQYAGRDGECLPKQETVAVELGVTERNANESVRTIDNLLTRGLPHLKLTPKLTRFPRAAVDEWLAERLVRRA